MFCASLSILSLVCLSVCLSVFLSVHLFIHWFICPPTCPYLVLLSVHLLSISEGFFSVLKILITVSVVGLKGSKNGPILNHLFFITRNIYPTKHPVIIIFRIYPKLSLVSLEEIFNFFRNLNFVGAQASSHICDLVLIEHYSFTLIYYPSQFLL